MKIKNVTFVERHLEKAVVAMGLLFVIVVGWFYFIGSPYAVSLTPTPMGATIEPAQVDDEVKREADRLNSKITATVSPLPPQTVPDYTESFRDRFVRGPMPGIVIYPAPLSSMGLGSGFKIEDIVIPERVVSTPPAPADVHARAGFAVAAAVDDPDLDAKVRQVVGQKDPADFHYVSVSAVFDMDEWRSRLKNGGPTGAVPVPDESRIPEDWWRGSLAITDVALERQTLDPATGDWGPAEPVAASPTAVSYANAPGTITPDEVMALEEDIKTNHDAIERPPFIPTSAGAEWVPPDTKPRELSREEQSSLRKINDDIRRLQGQIHRLQGGKAPVGGGAEPLPPTPSAGDHQMGPSGAGAPGGRPAPPVARPEPAHKTPAAGGPDHSADIQKLRNDLDAKLKEKNELLGLSIKPGDMAGVPTNIMGPPEGPRPPGTLASPRPPRTNPPPRTPGDRRRPGDRRGPDEGMLNGPEGAQDQQTLPQHINVWAHDLTVQPGMTYRYRVRVSVINPLYKKDSLLTPKQRGEFADRLSLVSEYSPWTEAVKTEPKYYFYLVEASNQGSGSVEIWHIFNGQWRSARYPVKPGYPIGGDDQTVQVGDQKVPLDMKVGAVVVDLATNSAGSGLGGSTTRLLYLDSSGQLQSRTLEGDRQDPKHTELLNAADQQVAAASERQP